MRIGIRVLRHTANKKPHLSGEALIIILVC